MSILGGPWTLKRVTSFFYLAVAFNVRQVRRLFSRGRSDDGGEERFLDNYVSEGMAPMTAADEDLIREIGRCIHCGLCEAVCPGPVDRWTTYSRATAMSVDAAASVPAACDAACNDCVDICPTGVPLTEIPAFVHRRG